MTDRLTSHPVVRSLLRSFRRLASAASVWAARVDRVGFAFRLLFGAYVTGLALFFFGTLGDFRDGTGPVEGASPDSLPSVIPIVFQGLGLVLAIGAFLLSLLVRGGTSPGLRRSFIVIALGLASIGGLVAWLPTDVIATREAIMGKAPAGEIPSIGAYFGLLGLVTLLILSIPVAALVYFKLGLMDRYVVHGFLSPFATCLFAFVAIGILWDLTDNGDILSVLPFSRVVALYVAQMPFLVLFVLPIAVLLSSLYALSRMSKANELISMIGAGRSVNRILAPLFITGAYISLVGLAFKYQWAPAAVGYKEAVIQTAKREQWVQRHGGGVGGRDTLWAHRGWMHVNDVGRRSWFVGRVPLVLSEPMSDVVVSQLDEDHQPVKMWIARRAQWVWDSQPPKWVLTRVKVYEFGEDRVPRIESLPRVEIEDWSETPWKVLSSSQSPEHLGIPGLTMYLNANRDLDDGALAPFRTNRWLIIAEPLACLAMVLVAAPLGIVYSRRGAMAGVTGAIGLFALLYLMQNTFLALGHSGRMRPIVAAFLANLVVAGIGLVLLRYRARNREMPKLKEFAATASRLFARLRPAP
jgi:lipopolysaccharide export system permease protein